jgi:hypothetical protein
VRLWMLASPEAKEGSQNGEHRCGENARGTKKRFFWAHSAFCAGHSVRRGPAPVALPFRVLYTSIYLVQPLCKAR